MAQTGLFIMAHAPLASALKAVAEHVYPDCASRLAVLDVSPGQSADQIEQAARTQLALLPQPEVLVLTDVFGATPCNVAQRLGDARRIRVVAGLNVSMLWRALCYADESADSLAERALAGASQGVMPVSSRAPQFQESRSVDHAQDHRHHQ